MGEATDVDVAASTITVSGQKLAFDYLVLAAGARTNYFGRDEWAKYAPGLKNIEEAIDVRLVDAQDRTCRRLRVIRLEE